MNDKTKEILMKVSKVITNVLFAIVLVLALGVTFMSLGKDTNDGVPSIFGYSPLAVKSESMSPKIKKGNLIFVKRNLGTLKEGDIITFKAIIEGEEELNTHRIMEVITSENPLVPDAYVTKGDNNDLPDQEYAGISNVAKTDVIGVYKGFKIPVLGFIVSFASTSLGFFLLVILPLLAYAIYYLVKVVMAAIDFKKENDQKAIEVTPVEEATEEVVEEQKEVKKE